MAKCEWALLCDYAFLDAGRKMCLIGIFDNIFAHRVPGIHHQAALVMRLTGDPNEPVNVKVEVVRPTGEGLLSLSADGILSETGKAEVHLNIAGLPLPDFGIYAFNIMIGEKLAYSVALSVSRPPSSEAKP